MRTNRFLMAAATAASLCCPVSYANSCILAVADTSAVVSGAADTSAVVGGDGVSGIKSVAPGASPRERSELTALLSSALGTGIPGVGALAASRTANDVPEAVLFLTGYMIGPSIGHFYSGRAGRAFAGIGIRGVALVGSVLGFAYSFDESGPGRGSGLLIASLLVGAGSVLYDIVDAPHSARVHNERVRRPLAISPAAVGGAPGVRVDLGM